MIINDFKFTCYVTRHTHYVFSLNNCKQTHIITLH